MKVKLFVFVFNRKVVFVILGTWYCHSSRLDQWNLIKTNIITVPGEFFGHPDRFTEDVWSIRNKNRSFKDLTTVLYTIQCLRHTFSKDKHV